MDDARFDNLIRDLASAIDRRELLRDLPIVLAAAGVVLALPPDAAAGKKKRRKKKKKRCPANTTRCGKRRCEHGVCCNGLRCGTGNCFCRRAIEGDTFCAQSMIITCNSECANSGECPPNHRCYDCVDLIGPDKRFCWPECAG